MSKVESLSIVQRGEAFVITRVEEYTAAGEYLIGATALVRQIQEYHKPLKEKAFDSHRAICDAEKNELRPIQSVIDRVKGLRVGFERQQNAIAEKERAKRQAQADKVAAKTGLTAPVIQIAPPPKVQGLSNRSTWKAEVVDEALIPREYLMPDQKKLDAAAKRMKGEFNIPGAKVVEDTNVIVRGV